MSEIGFCEDTTKMMLGLFVGERRKLISVPEVPHGYFSNEQIDMLLLDTKNKEYLCIEYKLNSPDKLRYQVGRALNAGLPCIGIINTKLQKPTNGCSYVFGYTGQDFQVEIIAKCIVYDKYRWRSIYDGLGMVYYWAYLHNQCAFDGGRTSGNRQGFASVYMQAIINLHKEYGKLDFMLTHASLKSGYSVATSKKYYRQAIK